MGLVISNKCREKRRALLPEDIEKNVNNSDCLYIETGYGNSIGINANYQEMIKNAIVIEKGHIIMEDIKKFRELKGAFCV